MNKESWNKLLLEVIVVNLKTTLRLPKQDRLPAQKPWAKKARTIQTNLDNVRYK
jgi:hypothetical protein